MKNHLPYRPILHLPKTKFEKIVNSIGLFIYGATILFLIVNWGNIPDKVPGHFNAAGEVDRWGSKYELITLPIIALLLFVIMSLVEKIPHLHNYPDRLNESNVVQFYTHSRKLLNLVKNILLVMFSSLSIQIVRVAQGAIDDIGIALMPIFLIVIFGTVGIGMYKQSKIKYCD